MVFANQVNCRENQSDDDNLDRYFLNSLLYFMKNRKSNKSKNNNIINVKVKESIDLTSPLSEIRSIKEKMITEGKSLKKQYNIKGKKFDKNIEEKKKDINRLKDSFDKVIQKTSNINNELNKKKDINTQDKVNLEANKIEIEKQLTSLSNALKDTENILSGKKEEYKNYIIDVLSLNTRLLQRVELSNKLSILKIESSKKKIVNSNLKKNEKRSSADVKILSKIDKNINKINEGLTSSYRNTTREIKNIRRVSLDEKNIKNLEFEKQQHNEQYQALQKIIKELLDKNEILQNQIKDLEKQKNKLKENLNTKEVESKIINDKLKTDIKNLQNDITKEEKNLLHIANTHKEILKEKEIRIKNLILILNKLLINYKLSKRKTSNSTSDLLNSILFDKKTVDLNSDDINEKVIEEISGQITK